MSFCIRALALLPYLLGYSITASAADQIIGSAIDRTTGRPAAGDAVILIRLEPSLDAEARTIVDARGKFSLPVKSREASYLLRVIHQGVNYDQRVFAGKAASVLVFDAAPRISGILGSIEIIRTQAIGNQLHVSDMYEIQNESRPPRTLSAARTFEAFLPADARLDSILAAGPEKLTTMISATPVPGEPGHFTVNYPLRPGATKFAFNYNLPYSGRASFQIRNCHSVQQLAVMVSPAMKFSSSWPGFMRLPTGNTGFHVYAINRLKSGSGPEFVISGTGALPPVGGRAGSKPLPGAFPNPRTSTQDSGVKAASAQIQLPTNSAQTFPHPYFGDAIGLLLLAICGLLIWWFRSQNKISATPKMQVNPNLLHSSTNLLDALREEVTRLEFDLQRGAVSRDEYVSTRQALEIARRRAFEKSK